MSQESETGNIPLFTVGLPKVFIQFIGQQWTTALFIKNIHQLIAKK
jgi:hypothetical protein